MRSHLIVAVLAFAAGALVVWLVVFAGHAQIVEPAPLQPGTSVVTPVSSAADEVHPAASTTSADVTATPTVAADALRQPTAVRRTTCVLGGFVRSSEESSRPVAHAYVGLFRPALEDDGPASQFGNWGGTAERFPKWRQLLTWTYTDDEGRFTFDELQAGTYVVHVEYGPLVTASTAPQTLEPGEVRAGLDVVMPLAGSLAGQILAPPDTTFDGWHVALEPSDPQQMHAMSIEGRSDNRLDKGVEDDGSFELGPSEAGLHRVLLVWPGRRTIFGHENLGLPIGEVMIVAGQIVQQTFDLRQGFPGSLNVTLSIPAYDNVDQTAFLHRVPFQIIATPSFREAKLESLQANCRIGETTVIGPLEPGVWSLSVQSPVTMWTFKVPREERVDAGQALDVSIEVQLYAGTLTCMDATTGDPLADADVMVWSNGSGTGVKTDVGGRVQILYPTGTYTIATYSTETGNFDDGLPETFDWQEDGPHPSKVKLLRPASAPR